MQTVIAVTGAVLIAIVVVTSAIEIAIPPAMARAEKEPPSNVKYLRLSDHYVLRERTTPKLHMMPLGSELHQKMERFGRLGESCVVYFAAAIFAVHFVLTLFAQRGKFDLRDWSCIFAVLYWRSILLLPPAALLVCFMQIIYGFGLWQLAHFGCKTVEDVLVVDLSMLDMFTVVSRYDGRVAYRTVTPPIELTADEARDCFEASPLTTEFWMAHGHAALKVSGRFCDDSDYGRYVTGTPPKA